VAKSPIILSQPLGQSVILSEDAMFSTIAVGTLPLFYHWRFKGTRIARATNSTLLLTNVQTKQAGLYSVAVSNRYGTTVSSNADLLVADPGLVTPPQNMAIASGTLAEFSAVASGASLKYQWLFNDETIPGQTASILAITNSGVTNEGEYSVVIRNALGVVTSSPAALNIQEGTSFLDPRAFLSLV
jgi:hypothetical protein